MKKIQIKKALLAAAMLAGVGMVYGEESAAHIVYCKATIAPGDYGVTNISVTLPPTAGYYDNNGNPLTYWDIGEVVPGGVADSWHGEGGPGRFTAKNSGNVGAYLYVMTVGANDMYSLPGNIYDPWNGGWLLPQDGRVAGSVDKAIFGVNSTGHMRPINRFEILKNGPEFYHMAFTTDTMVKVPTWHSLKYAYTSKGGCVGWYSDVIGDTQIGAYMGYVEAGDYLTFDLKFWAPRYMVSGTQLLFTFCVEASAFPLWDHGRAVE